MRRTIPPLTERSISASYTPGVTWSERAEAAVARSRGGESRGLDERQLTQLANAAWAAGLCLLMDGRRAEGAEWLRRAAGRYRESWEAGAPPDAWGRPIAAIKALLIAGDDAAAAARWALDAGAASAESPIGRYAGTLACLVLGDDAAAQALGAALQGSDGFPRSVADACVALAAGDAHGYRAALEAILASFEERAEFLEDVAVADTVLALQVLAAPRRLAVELRPSARLP
jgi:hypothetical protein